MNLHDIFIDASLIALTCVVVAGGLYWAGVIWHSASAGRSILTARQALDLPDPATWPSVCIIIPAHNEAHGIGELARTLLAQDYPHLHVVFALDRCTDDTEAVLRQVLGDDARFTLHAVGQWRPGWAGKVNAVWEGVSAAPAARSAGLLLFADADTLFDARCVRASVKLLLHRNAAMLSLLSTLTRRTWFERLIQPAAGLELLRQYPPARVNRTTSTRSLANGQFMLIRRDVYENLGGHAALSDALLEDLQLASLVKGQGVMSEVAFADGMLLCRMYDTWPAFTSGWRRIYAELAHRKPARLRRYAILNLVFGVLLMPLALLVITIGLARGSGAPLPEPASTSIAWVCATAGVVALLAYALAITLCLLRGRSPMSAVAAYPVAAGVVAWLLWGTARELVKGVPVKWAGREYVRQVR